MHPITFLLIVVVAMVVSLPLLKIGVDTLIKRQAQRAKIEPRDPLLVDMQPGKPALIYFTGAHCGPCKLVQKPVIQQLTRDLGDSFQFLEIDIEQNMEAAMRWGVMKVPRTFILDRDLKVHTTNLDVTLLAVLKRQLEEASQV
ncbi:MAG TPA: thioredoxin family protein [Phototrophicaceae bacterium]|jgi:thiol-disulfide isomerase/thioredoxin|nr:thioredoxin family protein [Phototrophicaceae bacterium]